MSYPTLLATGFDVFPGAPENPTAWAIRTLEQEAWKPEGANLETSILPVLYDGWHNITLPLLKRVKPKAVVSFGLSAKATGFTLESTARNAIALDRPDFAGACALQSCISADGPTICPTTLPLMEISQALRKANLPVVASDNAGDYLCNKLFYHLLHDIPYLNLRMAGFVHTPYLKSQMERLTSSGQAIPHGASLSEHDLLRGVKLILQTCANQLHRLD